MTAIARSAAQGRARADSAASLPLHDWLARLYLVGFVVVSFRPFELLLPLPGAAESVLLPGGAAVVLLLTPRTQLRRAPVSLVLLTLVVWLGASLLTSDSPGITVLTLRNELPSLIAALLVIGTMTPGVVARILLVTFSACSLWSLAGIVVFPAAGIAGADASAASGGWGGTFGHKNTLGIFAALNLSMVLAFVPRSARRNALIGALVVLVLTTRSATAASGCMAVGAAHAWMTTIGSVQRSRDRVVLKLLLVVAMIVAVLLIVGLLPELLGIYGKDLTFTGRTEIWSATLEVIDRRPLQGYGIGGVFADGRSPVTADLWAKIGFPASHAHNGALNMVVEAGLLGLGLYLAFVVRTIQLAVSCLASAVSAPYGRWAISTIVGLALMSVSEPLFRGPTLVLVAIVWTLLAGVVNRRRRDLDPDDRPLTVA